MPRQTKRQVAQGLIDHLEELRKEGRFQEADEMREAVEAAIRACRPQDRDALSAALAQVYDATPEPPAASTELAVRSWHDVEGVDAIVNHGVRQAKRAVNAGLKAADMARQIAETILEARLRMPNPDTGLPDILADRKYTKNIAHDLFVAAREGVTEEDVHRWATHKSLAKGSRNRMSDVMVDFLKGLDEDLDKARRYFPMIEFEEGESATEAVYAAYAAKGRILPRKGRTELAREDARRKAERLRQLEAGRQDEDLDPEEELARDLAALERVERGFIRRAERAASLPPEGRAKLKQQMNQMIVNLSAAAAQL
ncbi:hypothetical protein [Streptomyces sp. bgisy032]|uniref:hypothetical protein n=1 Tax=Streptomyces sp. bgisy032 TaxID=3413773 RepID=UPI003D712D4D